jgi:hypothetical protein
MNVAIGKFIVEHEKTEPEEPKAREEKFRMRRIDYSKRNSRPKQFNGIHRRRRKKIRL